MKRKLKRLLQIVLIIIVTCVCIVLGFRTRYINGIIVTQLNSQNTSSMGFMLETSDGKIIMIDGGTLEDSENVAETIMNKGGVVEAWFITNAYEKNTGTLEKIIEDGKIQVNNIYVSLNSEQWYLEHDQSDKNTFSREFLNILDKESVRDKVHEMALRQEFTIDNLNFKILKIKSPEYVGLNAGNNQSMVIKVSNNFKDIIFLGDLGEEVKKEFYNNNLDEVNDYSIKVSEETKDWINEFEVEENYETKDGNKTVRVW